jgi:4-carboxymuconolactone decarboxylase
MTDNEKIRAAQPVMEMRYAVLPERMPAIAPGQMSDEQRKVAAELAASRGNVRGPFVAMLRSPGLLERMQKLGEYVRFRSGLDLRINRMAGLLVTRHWTNQYEWHGHIPHALKAGLKPEIIEAIGEGRRPSVMAADEAVAYDFVTELYANKSVSDPTYASAIAKFGERGVIDLLGVVGYYATNAMIMNVARTPVPDGKPYTLAPMPQQLHPRT